MAYIQVDYNRYEYVTREGNPDDRWDRDDTAADITINDIRIVTTDQYHDIAVPFEIDPDKSYFLLWADYDAGDSFGNDANQVEFIDLFETEEKAVEAQKWLEKPESVGYIRENGAGVTLYKPWTGYFENLNSINVDIVRVRTD
jgi:hypothetical protein